ncbi:aminotransferase class I/II-fold pyridoxal phosphate-dependent enzyme [Zooshikella ganghwensis]|uniref:aminotransferase class I/II-fold pyridoxal phosphate-dependent enzyme n=1 Tax=Zooshikella ganghwensis TaxID=202772 RepID=UPI0003F6D78E|nr:aminotransferase class I/II-fold pyridoxal phosphate-dependent enzyme [Zooshikella ganghwensis]
MALEFGQSVFEHAQRLQEEGRDANQIAKILCEKDQQGHNYGIGIVLDGEGRAMASSSTLLEYATKEVQESTIGDYKNSNAQLESLKEAVLSWQQVPKEYWSKFKLGLVSDAGTGAVKTAVELGLMQNSALNTLGVETLGWPAYKAIAKVARVQFAEFAQDGIIDQENTLPIYQAGPMNTTGMVRSADVIKQRAKVAADKGQFVVLDRAYSGFEFARELADKGYQSVMAQSYDLQIRPFVEQGVPFCLAISPTKAFITFALRPCGLVLLFCPDEQEQKGAVLTLNTIIRARGSSFEHPITRAFAKAMINDGARLHAEHEQALARVAEAEAVWQELVKGTAIEYLYSSDYAGLFRNPQAKDDAAVHIYEQHIYPVFASNRCRQNVTGIPADRALAERHVKAFAEQCF